MLDQQDLYTAFLDDLRQTLCHALKRLPAVQKAHRGSWTVEQNLLHLWDSAQVNTLRILRAMDKGHLHSEGYNQDKWVDLQQGLSRRLLEQGWEASNMRLIALCENIPSEILRKRSQDHNLHEIGWQPFQETEELCLEDLIRDYGGHLKHHLRSLHPSLLPPVALAEGLGPVALPLETERLMIRPFVEEDLDALALMLADPEVVRYLPGPPRTREQSLKTLKVMMEHQQRYGFSAWAVENLSDGRLRGWSGLMEFDGTGEVELLYMFEPSAWGQGIATEAGRACVRAAREQVGLPRLIAAVMTENHASRRVLHKCGLKAWRWGDFFNDRLEMLHVEWKEDS